MMTIINVSPLIRKADQECGSWSWCGVLGNDSAVISVEVIQECDKCVKIGTANGVDSLFSPIGWNFKHGFTVAAQEVIDVVLKISFRSCYSDPVKKLLGFR